MELDNGEHTNLFCSPSTLGIVKAKINSSKVGVGLCHRGAGQNSKLGYKYDEQT